MRRHLIVISKEEREQSSEVEDRQALLELENHEGGEEDGEIEDVEDDFEEQIEHDFSY
jgi:hypothetical protein